MALVGKIRNIRLQADLKKRQVFYGKAVSEEEALALQLRQFNTLWANVRKGIPFYANLSNEYDLPQFFQNWEQFINLMPIVTRDMVQAFGAQMGYAYPKPDFFRTTGGTTSQPIQIPAWHQEQTITNPDLWYGRGWYGIQPDDKLFTIWGHSHLLGSGFTGWKNRIIRNIKDKLLGYYRYSAYDLSEKSMRVAADCLLQFEPKYVVGYSTALDVFARTNQDRIQEFSQLKLKAVIATAEGFPASDSANMIRQVFGCPVAMEYGAVETLVVAHTHPKGNYRTFWQNYFLDVVDKHQGTVLHVTSLYHRCFPLIRYQLGDEIELLSSEPNPMGIRRFKNVMGRCNDWVNLADGFKAHSEVFTHAIRGCKKVRQFQVVLHGEKLSIHYLSDISLNELEEKDILFRLEKVHPDLRQVDLKRVEKLYQSISGKTPMIHRI